MQNSKQKVDLQIYFNIAFLSNFILNEPVCYAKLFVSLSEQSFWTSTFQKT